MNWNDLGITPDDARRPPSFWIGFLLGALRKMALADERPEIVEWLEQAHRELAPAPPPDRATA